MKGMTLEEKILHILKKRDWSISQNVMVGNWQIDVVAEKPDELMVIETKVGKVSIPDVLRVASATQHLSNNRKQFSAFVVATEPSSSSVKEIASNNGVKMIVDTDEESIERAIFDNWEYVRARIKDLKREIVILVFGSYFPETELERLARLRDSLRLAGYDSTYLVSDLHSMKPALQSIELSYWALSYADLSFFVLSSKGKKDNVIAELNQAINNLSQISKTIVLVEDTGKREAVISSLMIEAVSNAMIRRAFFRNDEQLFKIARATAFNRLYEISPMLVNRSKTR
jgi:predicted RecB family endonuclease